MAYNYVDMKNTRFINTFILKYRATIVATGKIDDRYGRWGWETK